LIISILLGSSIFLASVGIQIMAIVGLVGFLQHRNRLGKFDHNLWVSSVALSGVMLIVFVGHLLQVGLWAGLFMWLGEFESYANAFYHSAVNFAALGYGDIVMSDRWRLLGAMEATGGILMFGISTGIGIAVVTLLLKRVKLIDSEDQESA
jgi:hypothetical protein